MAGSSRSSWSVSVVYRGQYDRRAAAQKRRGRGFPRQTRSPGQGAGKFPLASMVPSPAEERRRVEGSSALPEAELAGSLDRPGDRISFHSILHGKSSISLPLAVGGDWSPPVAQSAGSAAFGHKKARAFPVGKLGHFETRILCLPLKRSVTVWLQHSRRPAESQAPFRFLHHHSKMGRLPPKHHSAANKSCCQLSPNVQP